VNGCVLQMANIRLLKQYAKSGICEQSMLKTIMIEEERKKSTKAL